MTRMGFTIVYRPVGWTPANREMYQDRYGWDEVDGVAHEYHEAARLLREYQQAMPDMVVRLRVGPRYVGDSDLP